MKNKVSDSFISRNIYTDKILYIKKTDSIEYFKRQLNILRSKQLFFSNIKIEDRVKLLNKFVFALDKNKDILSQMVCEEVGRNIAECRKEIQRSIDLIKYYIKIAPKILQDRIIKTNANLSKVIFEPLGVVFAVMPWNYPIWQLIRFTIPSLCCGNACIVKPSQSVVRVTEKFFEILQSDDIPFTASYLSINDIEEAISLCDALAFTGSVDVGKKLATIAGKYLKKSVLELGGSNAQIVLNDADIDLAVKDACYSRFRDSGQSCNAIKRIILLPEIAQDFIDKLINLCKKLKMGNPLNEENILSPLHKVGASDKLQGFVDDAKKKGALVLLGGNLLEDKKFYPATIVDKVTLDSKMAQDEVFGPIVAIFRANSIDNAINIANSNQFGLGASVYSEDIKLATSITKKLKVGSVFINKYPSSDINLPFGGVKNSGYGRELSDLSLFEFVNIKSFWQN